MINKLVIACLISLLSSCAFITDSFLLAKFDPIEYQSMVKIRVMAKDAIATCDDREVSKANVEKLKKELEFLITYDEPIAHNTNVQHSLNELHEIVNGLSKHYKDTEKVSTTFCVLKLQIIANDAGVIQKVIGTKPK